MLASLIQQVNESVLELRRHRLLLATRCQGMHLCRLNRKLQLRRSRSIKQRYLLLPLLQLGNVLGECSKPLQNTYLLEMFLVDYPEELIHSYIFALILGNSPMFIIKVEHFRVHSLKLDVCCHNTNVERVFAPDSGIALLEVVLDIIEDDFAVCLGIPTMLLSDFGFLFREAFQHMRYSRVCWHVRDSAVVTKKIGGG